MDLPIYEKIFDVSVALLPVFLFLVALVFLDSFKLVRLYEVVGTIIFGALAAIIAYFVNTHIATEFDVTRFVMTRYVAPVTEEFLKALFIFFVIRTGRVGFMVDSAIHGFAAGAGFAFMENIWYLQTMTEPSLIIWILRGFGTAVMHGGTTAILAIITKSFTDRTMTVKLWYYLPGLGAAMGIHSMFNHFPLPPQYLTAIQLIILPPLMVVVFQKSENAAREWLAIGLDTDAMLLDSINNGRLEDSKVGRYLHTLTSHYPGELVADMLCMIRIHLELSVRAKGILLMREHGFDLEIEEDTQEMFRELDYLEKSVGTTGVLAIKPFLNSTRRDLWQLYMMRK